jgi:hypothetical protein
MLIIFIFQKNNVEIIQKHWFQTAGRKSSTVHEVRLYLAAFERIHLPLLFAVVNMADSDVRILQSILGYIRGQYMHPYFVTGPCSLPAVTSGNVLTLKHVLKQSKYHWLILPTNWSRDVNS